MEDKVEDKVRGPGMGSVKGGKMGERVKVKGGKERCFTLWKIFPGHPCHSLGPSGGSRISKRGAKDEAPKAPRGWEPPPQKIFDFSSEK